MPRKKKNQADQGGGTATLAPAPIEQETFLPGLEPVKNDRVHPKAIEYVRARNARMRLTKDEKEAHTDLLETMLLEGIESYTYGGLTVNVQNSRKCKAVYEGSGDPEEGEK